MKKRSKRHQFIKFSPSIHLCVQRRIQFFYDGVHNKAPINREQTSRSLSTAFPFFPRGKEDDDDVCPWDSEAGTNFAFHLLSRTCWRQSIKIDESPQTKKRKKISPRGFLILDIQTFNHYYTLTQF